MSQRRSSRSAVSVTSPTVDCALRSDYATLRMDDRPPRQRCGLADDQPRLNDRPRCPRARDHGPHVPPVLAGNQRASLLGLIPTSRNGGLRFSRVRGECERRTLKNSMWYADAPGAGAHAKRRALGLISRSPAFPRSRLGTGALGGRTSVEGGQGCSCDVSADAGVLPTCDSHVEEQQAKDRHYSHADEHTP